MANVNMRLLTLGDRYTRPELADLWGYQGYQAIAKGVVTPKDSGLILLFVTHIKQEALTQYRDYISGDYLYWEGEEKHSTDERVASAHQRGEEIHLFYRDIHHSPFTYRGLLEIRRFKPRINEPSEFVFRIVHDLGPGDDIALHRAEIEAAPETERLALVKARVGQGEFRDRLLEMWQGCALTSVEEPALLRASHIKPWRRCSNEERLNPFNGLLLLPQYDHLFDRGFITFKGDGSMVVSEVLAQIPQHLIGLDLGARLRTVHRNHVSFLEFHRDMIFVAQNVAD